MQTLPSVFLFSFSLHLHNTTTTITTTTTTTQSTLALSSRSSIVFCSSSLSLPSPPHTRSLSASASTVPPQTLSIVVHQTSQRVFNNAFNQDPHRVGFRRMCRCSEPNLRRTGPSTNHHRRSSHLRVHRRPAPSYHCRSCIRVLGRSTSGNHRSCFHRRSHLPNH